MDTINQFLELSISSGQLEQIRQNQACLLRSYFKHSLFIWQLTLVKIKLKFPLNNFNHIISTGMIIIPVAELI